VHAASTHAVRVCSANPDSCSLAEHGLSDSTTALDAIVMASQHLGCWLPRTQLLLKLYKENGAMIVANDTSAHVSVVEVWPFQQAMSLGPSLRVHLLQHKCSGIRHAPLRSCHAWHNASGRHGVPSFVTCQATPAAVLCCLGFSSL
jgi:hypothetical protein